jgi:hypothetical protein
MDFWRMLDGASRFLALEEIREKCIEKRKDTIDDKKLDDF